MRSRSLCPSALMRQARASAALALRLLNYLIAANPAEGAALALAQFERANNMSDRANALWALVTADRPERDQAFTAAEARFRDDPLLLDLWFTLNASIPGEKGRERVETLLNHPKFTLGNPNRVRALVGAFAHGNPRGFHAAHGAGYRLVAGVIGQVDGKNPQLAARLATAFRTWKALEPGAVPRPKPPCAGSSRRTVRAISPTFSSALSPDRQEALIRPRIRASDEEKLKKF